MLHNKELRDGGRTQMGLELFFLGRRFMINSDRAQILDLLVSTFEGVVAVNERLRAREEELGRAQVELVRRLAEAELERKWRDAELAAMPSGVVVVDTQCRIVNANETLAELVGAPLASLRGARVWDAIPFVDHRGDPVQDDARALSESLRGATGENRGTVGRARLGGGGGA